MKLSTDDVEKIRGALAVCRAGSVDAVVITDNKIRGVAPSSKLAIISSLHLSIDPTIKIGIGRLAEFEKRLSIFGGNVTIEGKTNDNNEAIVLTLAAGKSKVQFRCTAERLIKYPKENADEPVAIVKANKGEVAEISRAIKSLGAETFTIAVGRDGSVKVECSSPTNEAFATQLQLDAEFENDPQSLVNIYEGDRLATILDAAARDTDEVVLVIGELGSITLQLKGHELVALPNVNQEDDDE